MRSITSKALVAVLCDPFWGSERGEQERERKTLITGHTLPAAKTHCLMGLWVRNLFYNYFIDLSYSFSFFFVLAKSSSISLFAFLSAPLSFEEILYT